MPIRIREVRLDAGRMDFADYFIQPNFAAQIDDLHGTMTGLSTNPNDHAKVDLKGPGRGVLARHDCGRNPAVRIRPLHGHRAQVREHLAAGVQPLTPAALPATTSRRAR
jgi:hypothetical protein